MANEPTAEGKPASAPVPGYVAVLECSQGNDSVGDMWLETHICTGETTVAELMEWRAKTRGQGGKLIITKAT